MCHGSRPSRASTSSSSVRVGGSSRYRRTVYATPASSNAAVAARHFEQAGLTQISMGIPHQTAVEYVDPPTCVWFGTRTGSHGVDLQRLLPRARRVIGLGTWAHCSGTKRVVPERAGDVATTE